MKLVETENNLRSLVFYDNSYFKIQAMGQLDKLVMKTLKSQLQSLKGGTPI